MKLAHRFVQVLTAAVLAGSATLSGTGVGRPAAAIQEPPVFGLAHAHLPVHTVSWQQMFAVAGR